MRFLGIVIYYIFLVIIILSAIILGYYSYKNALQFEALGEKSIVESMVVVANEKVNRIESTIISSDNSILSKIDFNNIEALEKGWEDIIENNDYIDYLIVLEADKEGVLYLFNGIDGELGNKYKEIFLTTLLPHIKKEKEKGILKHWHGKIDKEYYLVSYFESLNKDHPFTVYIGYNVKKIISTLFPEIFFDSNQRQYINIVDEEGELIFGNNLKGVESFIVGRVFPTTFYRWRLQLSPIHAEELIIRAKTRKITDAILIGIALFIIISAIGIFSYAAYKERHLSKLKIDFISNVTHEIKTPLAIIKMFSDLLLMGKIKEEEKLKQYYEIIYKETQRLIHIIDNVLDFSRLERGKFEYNKEVLDIREIINDIRELYEPMFKVEGKKLTLKLIDKPVKVFADPEALKIAIVNLLDNTLKYAKESPEVIVELDSNQTQAVLKIIDFGPGIPHKEHKKVFERFYRIKSSGKSKGNGTGIGLSIVKSIVKAHEGSVYIDKKTKVGTTFVIELPLIAYNR